MLAKGGGGSSPTKQQASRVFITKATNDTRRTGHANLARAVVQDRIVASGGPKGSLQAVSYGEHDGERQGGVPTKAKAIYSLGLTKTCRLSLP